MRLSTISLEQHLSGFFPSFFLPHSPSSSVFLIFGSPFSRDYSLLFFLKTTFVIISYEQVSICCLHMHDCTYRIFIFIYLEIRGTPLCPTHTQICLETDRKCSPLQFHCIMTTTAKTGQTKARSSGLLLPHRWRGLSTGAFMAASQDVLAKKLISSR